MLTTGCLGLSMQGGQETDVSLSGATAAIELSLQALKSKLRQHERLNARIMQQAAGRYMQEAGKGGWYDEEEEEEDYETKLRHMDPHATTSPPPSSLEDAAEE